MSIASKGFAEENKACPRLFEQLDDSSGSAAKARVVATVKNGLLWLPRQQHRYWKDVWDTRGRRLLLTERVPDQKFNYLYLLDPLMAPITVPLELVKSRFNLSAPALVATSVAEYAAWDLFASDRNKNQLAWLPGFDSIEALADYGVLAPSRTLDAALLSPQSQIARAALIQHEKNLIEWSNDQTGTTLLPRFVELRKIGVLKDDDELRKLNQLAHSVLGSGFCQNTRDHCGNLSGDFGQEIKEKWIDTLLREPIFKSKPVESLKLLALAFTPPIRLARSTLLGYGDFRSDLDLLAQVMGTEGRRDSPLRALKPLSVSMPLSDLLLMALEMPLAVEEAREKEAYWKKVSSIPPPDFVKRPEVPYLRGKTFSFDSNASGLSMKLLHGEMGVWELVWTDPRFEDIRLAFQENQGRRELELLGEALDRIGELNNFYIHQRTHPVPDSDLLCRLIGLKGEDQKLTILERTSHTLLTYIQGQRQWSEVERERCLLEIGDLVYRQLSAEAMARSKDDWMSLNQKFLQKINELTPRCSLGARRCSQSGP